MNGCVWYLLRQKLTILQLSTSGLLILHARMLITTVDNKIFARMLIILENA